MRINRLVLMSLLLAAFMMLAAPQVAPAAIVFSVSIAPPPLPVYVQPPCPGPGYMWVPGYWAYNDAYFWVPGTWVLIPEIGFYWTPGYWGWNGALFVFNVGYWGPQVGFYGGINYGFGYTGFGYQGGYWKNSTFFYNRTVTNVGSVQNVYNRTVTAGNMSRVSFNGGAGGITARPTATEMAAAHAQHIGPTQAQNTQVQTASRNRQLYASVNHGRPPVAATAKPGQFGAHGATQAHAAPPLNRAPEGRTAAKPAVAPPNRTGEASRMVKPEATHHAEIRPQPHHPANVKTQPTHQAHAAAPRNRAPEGRRAANRPAVAHPSRTGEASRMVKPEATHHAEIRPQPHHPANVKTQPTHQAHAAAPNHVHGQPHVAQARPPAARGPVQQRRLPRTQPMAHAAPHPQSRPAPAPHNAETTRSKS